MSQLRFLFVIMVTLLSLSCAPKNTFFYGAMGLGDPQLIIANSLEGVYSYDLQGQFKRILANYTHEGMNPRGLVPLDSWHFAVVLEGGDIFGQVDLLGNKSDFIVSSDLTGNLFQARKNRANHIFVIKNNTIESFSTASDRIGNPRIATTVGACVLSTPRGLAFTHDDKLVVVNTGNDRINIYDVSDPTNTQCLATNTTLGDVNPVAVIGHINGKIYVATQGDDKVYEFNGDGSGSGTVIFSNISVVTDPTALLELPDGNILVASDGTGSIEEISTSGARIASPFIANSFDGSVADMILVGDFQ
jgi:DNA-binding beta-propeller fold protein YncE